MNIFAQLYELVRERKESPEEGSYTCYLFEKGIDKILKKCGEECTEMVIAAKNCKENRDHSELKNEVADLIYHILVMCAELELDWSEVEAVLTERRAKIGNLKTMRVTDKDT
jgi:phosphoribosyl-ATP pyrophosphohydrolase